MPKITLGITGLKVCAGGGMPKITLGITGLKVYPIFRFEDKPSLRAKRKMEIKIKVRYK